MLLYQEEKKAMYKNQTASLFTTTRSARWQLWNLHKNTPIILNLFFPDSLSTVEVYKAAA